MDSSYFPHLAAGEIAFRGYSHGSATDAYANASAMLSAHDNVSDTFMAVCDADGLAIHRIAPDELRRLARVEAVAAGMPGAVMRAASVRMAEIAADAAELRDTGRAGTDRIANGIRDISHAFKRGDSHSAAAGLSIILNGARDLASNAALSAGAVTACHELRTTVADALTMGNDDFKRMIGSPLESARSLASAVAGLAQAMDGGSLEEARQHAHDVAAYALSLDGEATRLMGDLRAADERAHAHNATVADLRANLETVEGQANRSDAEWIVADDRAKAATARADKAEAQLARIMGELGGLTLSQLPSGAYGGALADAYCDIKAGRT